MLWKARRGNRSLEISGLIVIYFAYFITITPTELVVNVKNHGGEVFQESIWANLTDDTVHLEVEQPDGSVIIQLIDFRNEIQILNAFILGEEERNAVQFQVLCFVSHFDKAEFIPVDAMAKLRQKNPWAIRSPERDLADETLTMDVLLDISTADWISPHISTICAEARGTTYGTESQLKEIVTKRLANRTNDTSVEPSMTFAEAQERYLRTVKPFPIEKLECNSRYIFDKPCQCQLNLCIRWYPCALKFCQVHDTSGKSPSSYRCGIQTCKKCRHFVYSVARKFFCVY